MLVFYESAIVIRYVIKDFDAGMDNINTEPMTLPPSAEPKCDVDVSPNETRYWILMCARTLKPRFNQYFPDIESACWFYDEYASATGFDTRCGTINKDWDDEIVMRYILCSREGFKHVI